MCFVFEEKEWRVKGVKAGEEAVARIKRILEAVVLTLPGKVTEELETLAMIKKTEPEFVNLLRSPGIDSQPWRAGTATLFEVPTRQESIPGLLKYLQIRAQRLRKYSKAQRSA